MKVLGWIYAILIMGIMGYVSYLNLFKKKKKVKHMVICPVCQCKMTAIAVDRHSATWRCENRHCGKEIIEHRRK